MNAELVIEPARPSERLEALCLAFQHLSAQEQTSRAATAHQLVDKNELDPNGILVARAGARLAGAVICMTTPGAGSLVWPPQVAPRAGNRTEIEDRLLHRATTWLQDRGAKLAQSMLLPAEVHLGAPLRRHGFTHITTLSYLRRELDSTSPPIDPDLTFQPYPDDPRLFEQTLLQTYEDTADCPELTGTRTIDEIIDGHRAQGKHDPHRWWLARCADGPVGVLLLAQMEEWDSWDIAYVGVTAPARRRGFGRQLVNKAVAQAHVDGVSRVTLSVDRRNRPAWNLYASLGFSSFDEREVFLAVWKRQ